MPTIDVTIFSYSKYILESVIKSLRMFPYILLHERQSHIEGQILQHMKLEVLCWRTAMLIISLLSVDLKGKKSERLSLTHVLTKLFLPFRSLSMNKLTQLNDHLLRDTNNLEYM